MISDSLEWHLDAQASGMLNGLQCAKATCPNKQKVIINYSRPYLRVLMIIDMTHFIIQRRHPLFLAVTPE